MPPSDNNRRGGTILIDPLLVYFAHARIRPVFSGCVKGGGDGADHRYESAGMRIEESIKRIAEGTDKIKDVPLISIMQIDGAWFSLNNRRLYMFKQLRRMGLVENNEVECYRKEPLERERKKYSVQNCVLEAKLMGGNGKRSTGSAVAGEVAGATIVEDKDRADDDDDDEGGEDESEDGSGSGTERAQERREGIVKKKEKNKSTRTVATAPSRTITAAAGHTDSEEISSSAIVTTETMDATVSTIFTTLDHVAVAAVNPGIKAAKVKKLDLAITVAARQMKKLVTKGKYREVMSQLDEWLMNGLVDDDNLDVVLDMFGMERAVYNIHTAGGGTGGNKNKNKKKGKK